MCPVMIMMVCVLDNPCSLHLMKRTIIVKRLPHGSMNFIPAENCEWKGCPTWKNLVLADLLRLFLSVVETAVDCKVEIISLNDNAPQNFCTCITCCLHKRKVTS